MLSTGETQTLRTPSTGASHEIKRPSGDNFAPKNVGLSNSFRRGIRGRADMSAPVDEIPDGTGIRLLSNSRQRFIPAVAPGRRRLWVPRYFGNGGGVPFFATTGGLIGATGGFSAAARAGQDFAPIAGSEAGQFPFRKPNHVPPFSSSRHTPYARATYV